MEKSLQIFQRCVVPEPQLWPNSAMLTCASLVRLVDCLLGQGAAAPDKLFHGNPLTVLGMDITIDESGMTCRPDAKKAFKWRCRIQKFLETGTLLSGDASKLAGALQWASQHTFRRLGRAMLRPIFQYVACYTCDG